MKLLFTFFLPFPPWSTNCALSVYSSVHLSFGPPLLSLHVNKLHYMEGHYQYIQEEIPLVTVFSLINYNIINDFLCDFLLFLVNVFSFVVFYLHVFLMFLIYPYNWPNGCYPSTITIKSADYYYYYYYHHHHHHHHLLYAGYLYLYSRDKLLLLLLLLLLLFITLLQSTYN